MEQSKVRELQDVVIRFSGDSGDGMQLTGTLFSDTSALLGNGISTFPDYPAEIRAPQGTVAGVSGFQVHFGDHRELNPGDYCDVLVAMNPAALKANRKWLKPGATVILDGDSITEEHLKKAGFATLDPLAELKLDEYNVVVPDITSMTREALKETGLDNKAVVKCKNMFALGICFWLFDRPEDYALKYLDGKFAKKNPAVAQANKLAIAAGYNYAANTHQFANNYTVAPAPREKGTYRSINGNVATAWGLCAAAEKAGLPLFCGSYPITPATVILEELAKRKDLGVKTVQAEDEIAGICTAIGAAFAGNFAVTTTSGPGLSLKSEALGLAVMTELPLVVVDVQRGGPSTGLPTKTEQSDLQQALYGRNGECAVVVRAASTPGDCFRHSGILINSVVRTSVMMLSKNGVTMPLPWKSTMVLSNPIAAARALSCGAGIVPDMSLYHAYQHLESGEWQIVMPGWQRPSVDAFLYTTEETYRKRRIRTLIDWLSEHNQKIDKHLRTDYPKLFLR